MGVPYSNRPCLTTEPKRQLEAAPPCWPSGKGVRPESGRSWVQILRVTEFFRVKSYQWLKKWHSSGYPASWRYRFSTATGRPSVTILWLGEVESLICNFLVWQHLQLCEQIRPWDKQVYCWDVKQPTNKLETVCGTKRQSPPGHHLQASFRVSSSQVPSSWICSRCSRCKEGCAWNKYTVHLGIGYCLRCHGTCPNWSLGGGIGGGGGWRGGVVAGRGGGGGAGRERGRRERWMSFWYSTIWIGLVMPIFLMVANNKDYNTQKVETNLFELEILS